MKLVLYGVAVSAFVAKVRIALDLKGLDHEERPPPGGYGSAEYRAVIPAGSVPGLTVDGAPLHESNAIAEFLDEVVPEPPLMPADPLARARARALLGFHDTRVEAAARAVFPLIKTDPSAEAVEAAASGIEAALARLADLLPGAPPGPTLAQLAYPCTLQMAGLMTGALGRPLKVPAPVAAWTDAVAPLPAVQRSLTLQADAMRTWMAGFGKP
ncbi:MAG: glutathione S-transferase N-terminal domain-containing protein [Pseudomonadota bacterium]